MSVPQPEEHEDKRQPDTSWHSVAGVLRSSRQKSNLEQPDHAPVPATAVHPIKIRPLAGRGSSAMSVRPAGAELCADRPGDIFSGGWDREARCPCTARPSAAIWRLPGMQVLV